MVAVTIATRAMISVHDSDVSQESTLSLVRLKLWILFKSVHVATKLKNAGSKVKPM